MTGLFFIFEPMGTTENHSSFDKFNQLRLAGLDLKINRPLIIADRLRTPENMGSLLRLAGNIGAEKTIFISDVAHLFRLRKINKNAASAKNKTEWEIRDEDNLCKVVPPDYQIVAIETTDTAQNIFEFQFPEKVAFLVGNEVYGIRPEILKQTHHQVYIPIPGPVSSLNVSHALSVALFEWLRQQAVDNSNVKI